MIAGLLFMAGMRRSEVSALRWSDVDDAADVDGVLVTVHRGKTNQEGEIGSGLLRRPGADGAEAPVAAGEGPP